MSSVAVVKRIAAMAAELDALLAEPLDGLSTAERLAVTHGWETLMRRLPVVTHRLVAGLAEVPTEELGEPTLAAAWATLLRISRAEAHRRIHEARELGPRCAVTGEALEPVLSHTAAAQRRGDIGAEHVKIIRRFVDQLPALSTSRPVRRPRRSSLGSLAGSRPRSCVRPRTGWRSCLIRTASSATGTGRGGAL